MTSLAAVRDEAELRAWGSRLGKQGVINPAAVDWVVEPKVDGLAVRVLYRWGGRSNKLQKYLVCTADELSYCV
jgi:NAD-dependent DNA ligase